MTLKNCPFSCLGNRDTIEKWEKQMKSENRKGQEHGKYNRGNRKRERNDGKLAEDDRDYYDVYRSYSGCYFGKNAVLAGILGRNNKSIYCLYGHAVDREAGLSHFLLFADRGVLPYAKCEKIRIAIVFIRAPIGNTF